MNAAANGINSVDLDWWKNLVRTEGRKAFTPVSRINIEGGVYQFCDHSDAERFQNWGWTCDEDLEYENPWRDADGKWPTTLKPYWNCSEWQADSQTS